MPRKVRSPPSTLELKETLDRVVSVSTLARHYGVSFTTARKWLRTNGFQGVLDSPEYHRLRQDLISRAPIRATRRRIDLELNNRLEEIGDRKLLARAIVDEFSMRYMFKKSEVWKRCVLIMTLVMYDLPPVQEVSNLVGVPCRLQFRKAKSGVRVPCWVARITGYRAFKVLQLVRPYLVGQKAFQADIALQNGPIMDTKITLQKEIYRQKLLNSLKL
jgi:transposase-like protein